MKQYITPKQAKQITKEEFYTLFPNLVDRKDWPEYHHKKITIGIMIQVLFENNAKFNINVSYDKLCDNLWDQIREYLIDD